MKYLIPFVLLAACATAPPLPPRGADTCGAADFADLIGQPATALEQRLYLGQVRVIAPGDVVTQDMRPTRVNFMIDARGMIAAINCG